MKNEKENKFLFFIAVVLLAVLVLMIMVKIFIFDKNKEKLPEVPDCVINELNSYLDIKNVNNDVTFYMDQYIDSKNLGYVAIGNVAYNYIKRYDNLKIEVVSEDDKKVFNKEGVLDTKIKLEDFKKVIAYLFNETFDYDYTEFSIDEETSACLNGDYIFIYKLNEPKVSNNAYYHGMLSYTMMDNNNTIKITEYYLGCDKKTKYCYNNQSYDKNMLKKNNYVLYDDMLDVSTITEELKKYVHTFKKVDEHYKWFSVEPVE